MLKVVALAAAITLGSIPWANRALAEIAATCGASEGFAYYLPGGAVPADQAGWQKDKISSGGLQLISSGEDIDIVFTDATGGTKSSRADGASVVGIPSAGDSLLVLVIYPNSAVIEHYLFKFGADSIVVWGQVKGHQLISKGSLYVASCDLN